MNNFLIQIFTIIIININYCFLFSQDSQFSDPSTEKIFINPAYSGVNLCPEFNINYKRQNPYNLMSLSYNQFINKLNGGIGILVFNDSQGKGTINTFYASAIYSYKVELKKRRNINFAIQIGYIQRNIEYDKLIFSDMIDPFLQSVNQSTNEQFALLTFKRIDFASSFLLITNNFRTGFVVSHINNLFYKGKGMVFPVKYTFHFGKVFSIKNNSEKSIKIIPELFYMNQQNFHKFIYGINLKTGYLLTNFWLKHNIRFNSISPVFTFGYINANMRISYTYDFMLTKHYTFPISSHQISLIYNFDCDKKRKNKNTIYCNKK